MKFKFILITLFLGVLTSSIKVNSSQLMSDIDEDEVVKAFIIPDIDLPNDEEEIEEERLHFLHKNIAPIETDEEEIAVHQVAEIHHIMQETNTLLTNMKNAGSLSIRIEQEIAQNRRDADASRLEKATEDYEDKSRLLWQQKPVVLHYIAEDQNVEIETTSQDPFWRTTGDYHYNHQLGTYTCKYYKYGSKPMQVEFPVRFGLYKGDLLDAGLFAANVASEYALNKYTKNQRVEGIVEKLLSNASETAHFLQKLTEIEERTAKEHEVKFATAKIHERVQLIHKKNYIEQAIKEACQTYAKELYGMSYNPLSGKFLLNKTTMPVIIARFLLNRATEYIEKKYIIPDYTPEFVSKRIAGINQLLDDDNLGLNQLFAEEDEDDVSDLLKEEKVSTKPISILWPAKLLIHPKYCFQSASRHLAAYIQGAQQSILGYTDEKVPAAFSWKNMLLTQTFGKWATRQDIQSAAVYGAELLTEAVALKWFDDYLMSIWVDFLCKHRIELADLLDRYSVLKEKNNSSDLKKCEKQIRDFVVEAHAPVWFFPASHWHKRIAFGDAAKSRIGWLFSGTIGAIGAYKLYQFIKANNSSSKN